MKIKISKKDPAGRMITPHQDDTVSKKQSKGLNPGRLAADTACSTEMLWTSCQLTVPCPDGEGKVQSWERAPFGSQGRLMVLNSLGLQAKKKKKNLKMEAENSDRA